MRSLRWILVCAALSGIAGLAAGFVGARLLEDRTSQPESGFMATQRGHLARLDGASAPGRVVFLGSSTFQGLDVSAVTPLGLNLGIGGDTLPGLAKRITGYRSLQRARAVLINIGLNDLMQRCKHPDTPLDTLLAQIPATVPVAVLGVQAVDPGRHGARCDGRIAQLIAEFNAAQARACAARPQCRFVPHPATPGDPRATIGRWLEQDGIHLSPAGYLELAGALRGALSHIDPALAATAPTLP